MAKYTAKAAMIAAIYAAVSVVCALIPGFGIMQFGMIQVRLSEALTVLAGLTPAAVPGLFIGCILSNIIGMTFFGGSLLDVIFGSLATLLAAYCSHLLRRNRFLVPLPPVIINAVVVGIILKITAYKAVSLWLLMLSVGVGQAISCYALGLPLLCILGKRSLNRS